MPATATASTIIGACIAIAASILNAIGYTVQKKGHNKLNSYNRNNNKQKKLFQEKTWCIGFAIFIAGGIANAIALYFAPQSLVLPLSAVTLVANTILAVQILGEPFMKISICGIFMVIMGSTLAVIFGPRTGGDHINIEQLKDRWTDPGFLIFFVLLSLLTIIDYIAIKYYESKNIKDEDVAKKEIVHGKSFLLLSYGFMNAYFGSNAFLFLKAFTEFLGGAFASTHNARDALQSWYSYFILVAVIGTNALYVMWQQRGLSFFPSTYVIPINQVSLIIMGTIVGGIYFDEFENFEAVNAALFCIAILLTSFGVVVLAAGHRMFKDMNIPISRKISEYLDIAPQSPIGQVSDGSDNEQSEHLNGHSKGKGKGRVVPKFGSSGNLSANGKSIDESVATNQTDYMSVEFVNPLSDQNINLNSDYSFVGAASK